MFRDRFSGMFYVKDFNNGLFADILLVSVDRSRPFRLIRKFVIFAEPSGH